MDSLTSTRELSTARASSGLGPERQRTPVALPLSVRVADVVRRLERMRLVVRHDPDGPDDFSRLLQPVGICRLLTVPLEQRMKRTPLVLRIRDDRIRRDATSIGLQRDDPINLRLCELHGYATPFSLRVRSSSLNHPSISAVWSS